MNVVVVCLDSLRKDHVGAYGNDWIRTPNLDALAKDSMRFTRAYPESMHTVCARRSLYSGKRTWPFRNWDPLSYEENYSAGWQPMPRDQVSFAEILSGEGYHTALITDNYHIFKPSYNFQRGFDIFNYLRGQESDLYRLPYSVPEAKVKKHTIPGNIELLVEKVRQYFANVSYYRNGEEDYFAPQVFSRSMDYLDAAVENGGEPFFLVVDSFDPHEPWDPPQSYIDLYSDGYSGREPIVPNYSTTDYLTDRQLERMKTLYSAELTMTDEWFGRFMDKMEDLGLMENTLLFVFSDHGMGLGEHGYTGKPFNLLWPEMTDIVYYVHHPRGKGAGQTSDFYVSNHDIAPSVLASLGIKRPEQMNGQDITPLLEGGEPEEERKHFTLGCDEYSWCRDEDYAMFCVNDMSYPKLYDLREDPGMHNDIAAANPEVVRRMYEDYIVADAGGTPPPLREEARVD